MAALNSAPAARISRDGDRDAQSDLVQATACELDAGTVSAPVFDDSDPDVKGQLLRMVAHQKQEAEFRDVQLKALMIKFKDLYGQSQASTRKAAAAVSQTEKRAAETVQRTERAMLDAISQAERMANEALAASERKCSDAIGAAEAKWREAEERAAAACAAEKRLRGEAERDRQARAELADAHGELRDRHERVVGELKALQQAHARVSEVQGSSDDLRTQLEARLRHERVSAAEAQARPIERSIECPIECSMHCSVAEATARARGRGRRTARHRAPITI